MKDVYKTNAAKEFFQLKVTNYSFILEANPTQELWQPFLTSDKVY